MPRDGSGVYTQPFPDVVAGTTIESAKYNGNVNDVEQDLNTPRPVVAGGTGGTDVNSALDNLSAEKYKQVVTNWDTNVWRAGSFYAATSATGAAPIPGKAFAGIVYYANATDFVIEATNITDPGSVKYIRKQTAGVWDSWSTVDTSKKNYIINGAMMVSQEFGTTGLGSTGQYPVDMFYYAGVVTAAGVAFAQVQAGTPGGSTHRIRITVTGTDATQDAGDFAAFQTAVEGYRYADLWAGQTTPKQVTLRFGVKAPQGTYCVAFRNSATTRSYVAEYTITPAENNADVVKTVTLPATDGTTFNFDNLAGVYITWAFMAGLNFRTTPNGWRTGNYMGTTNQSNFMGTFGNVFELFDVSLTEGTVAPPFVVPDYANELQACKRYWGKSYSYANPIGSANLSGGTRLEAGTASVFQPLMAFTRLAIAMRATPTLTVYDTAGTPNKVFKGVNGKSVVVQDASENGFTAGAGDDGPAGYVLFYHWKADARL